MPLSNEIATFIASNILEDGYSGDIGIYNDERILFWIDDYEYPKEDFNKDLFNPILTNVTSDLDPDLKLLAKKIELLFNFTLQQKEVLSCSDTNSVANQFDRVAFEKTSI